MKFERIYYILATIILFFIEVYIAIFVKDDFIRPFFGDFLASIWLFCLISSFSKKSVYEISINTILLSYFIEFLQYIKILKTFGLEKHKILSVVLGTSFAWEDILAYTLGIAFVILVHFFRFKNHEKLC